jgi:hypothetical protein
MVRRGGSYGHAAARVDGDSVRSTSFARAANRAFERTAETGRRNAAV